MTTTVQTPGRKVAPPRRDRTHYLYLAVLVAVALGIVVGLVAPSFAVGLKPVGTAFVALIKMMIQPVIFCTIVLGIGSIRSAARVGKVGDLALGYFLVMSTAALGIGLHQLTGHHEFDAAGSIAIGLLLAGVAIFLMRRNMDYLLGEAQGPEVHDQVLARILEHPDVNRVTYLHLEFVGPQRLFVVAAVDLTGDDREPDLARRLRVVESDVERSDLIEQRRPSLIGRPCRAAAGPAGGRRRTVRARIGARFDHHQHLPGRLERPLVLLVLHPLRHP